VKIGLFGGSFDPPHRGHVDPVQGARRRFGLERVIYLPTSDPPHKAGQQLAPALRRYVMVELALLGEDGLFASPHELTPGQTAYTVDTVEHFQRRLPDAELHLLLGSDSLAQLTSWRRWRELAAAVRLVALERPGWEAERLERDAPPEVLSLLQEGRAVVAGEARFDVSSTELRRQLARGEAPPGGVLSPRVLDYIQKYDLYR
jgi:nicotinate-nucleotide adenylyltransferase